ncbi:hypothetical protein [Nocardia camponoti]|uniref:Uncharacterized protein n=1 Tax=Nocardia camponoti TaxID=1616106 RepID=A0A917V9K6_9NOCA|nr:hypothetical protein [Nocardia camponoti]GGK53354.1 hypothetical protein GCM10011591_26470 [Nocardia camponoti]
MLTINFDDNTEWWTSGGVFDRLFEAAVASGAIPGRMSHWGDVVNANGGYFAKSVDPLDAQVFRDGLLSTAYAELPGLPREGLDWTYKVSLTKLIRALGGEVDTE